MEQLEDLIQQRRETQAAAAEAARKTASDTYWRLVVAMTRDDFVPDPAIAEEIDGAMLAANRSLSDLKFDSERLRRLAVIGRDGGVAESQAAKEAIGARWEADVARAVALRAEATKLERDVDDARGAANEECRIANARRAEGASIVRVLVERGCTEELTDLVRQEPPAPTPVSRPHRAIADTFLDGGLRRAGQVFDYAGPPDPNLVPVSAEAAAKPPLTDVPPIREPWGERRRPRGQLSPHGGHDPYPSED